MHSHRDFAAAFRAGLTSGTLPDGALAPEAELARRFAVYRNNVAHGLSQALARRYPALERLVGADCFAGLARLFIAAHPPRGAVLAEWGAEFAAFLAQQESLTALPYLPDIARIEWARGRAYHAADQALSSPEMLREITGQTRLALHPSVQILSLATPAGRIWVAQQPGGPAPPAPEAWSPDTVLIARNTAMEVITLVLPGTMATLARHIASGAALETALAKSPPEPDLAGLLSILVSQGLIVGFLPDPRD